jgi:hypothetical protein
MTAFLLIFKRQLTKEVKSTRLTCITSLNSHDWTSTVYFSQHTVPRGGLIGFLGAANTDIRITIRLKFHTSKAHGGIPGRLRLLKAITQRIQSFG